MNEPELIKDQKLLSPAALTEEDEFYAECNINGINLVDRVNGKPVYVYPYWIDRPNCNWHSPPKPEDDEDYFTKERDEDEDDKSKGNKKGLINGLKNWWQRNGQQD